MGSGHKDKPKLLIEFDAIVDLKLGFYYYCKKYNPNIVDKSILDLPLNELREKHFKDKEFFNNMLAVKEPKVVREAYEDVMSNHLSEIYSLSPIVPSIEKLITVLSSDMAKNAGAGGLCELLARNSEELAILKSRFPKTPIIDRSGKEIFETDDYARIIISEPSHIERYKCKFTLMAVLSYAENVEVIDGKKAIADMKAMSNLHVTNAFELIDPVVY